VGSEGAPVVARVRVDWVAAVHAEAERAAAIGVASACLPGRRRVERSFARLVARLSHNTDARSVS
jgi:hypothetical protein